jgi:hypothetical protein
MSYNTHVKRNPKTNNTKSATKRQVEGVLSSVAQREHVIVHANKPPTRTNTQLKGHSATGQQPSKDPKEKGSCGDASKKVHDA